MYHLEMSHHDSSPVPNCSCDILRASIAQKLSDHCVPKLRERMIVNVQLTVVSCCAIVKHVVGILGIPGVHHLRQCVHFSGIETCGLDISLHEFARFKNCGKLHAYTVHENDSALFPCVTINTLMTSCTVHQCQLIFTTVGGSKK